MRDRNLDGTFDETLYATTDGNYNITALIDEAGQVVERYMYDPYGKLTILNSDFSPKQNNESQFDWTVTYTGHNYDKETKLYYANRRYYSPNLGKWISRDPLEYVDGNSLYTAYFAQRFWVDPVGLSQAAPPAPQAPSTQSVKVSFSKKLNYYEYYNPTKVVARIRPSRGFNLSGKPDYVYRYVPAKTETWTVAYLIGDTEISYIRDAKGNAKILSLSVNSDQSTSQDKFQTWATGLSKKEHISQFWGLDAEDKNVSELKDGCNHCVQIKIDFISHISKDEPETTVSVNAEAGVSASYKIFNAGFSANYSSQITMTMKTPLASKKMTAKIILCTNGATDIKWEDNKYINFELDKNADGDKHYFKLLDKK